MKTSRCRRYTAAALICHGLCMPWLMLSLVAQAEPAREMSVAVGKTVEITSSKRYCWFPTVHRFSTGEILVTMRISPDEVHPEGELSAYCVSSDGGKTWSQRYTLGAGANGTPPTRRWRRLTGPFCRLAPAMAPRSHIRPANRRSFTSP